MATIRKQHEKWQAQIRLKGIKPIARSFSKRADAVTWATITESEIIRGEYVDQRSAESVTLTELIDRYLRELKASENQRRSTESRCGSLRLHLGRFALNRVAQQHLAQYRDQRLLTVSSMTVIHELNLLHRIMRLAVTEWGYRIAGSVPTVRLPKRPAGRTRRLRTDEQEMLMAAMNGNAELRAIVVLALETGMRRGEIARIKREHIDFEASTLLIPETKTGEPRMIPLTGKALEVLGQRKVEDGLLFALSPERITEGFRQTCARAAIKDFRFHDLRHEAVSRFFERGLNTLEVAAISGHKTLEMLNRYTHISAEHLAKKLCHLEPDPSTTTRGQKKSGHSREDAGTISI